MIFTIVEQPVNNRGDEAAHKGLVASLVGRYPHAKINILFFEKTEAEVEVMRTSYPNVHYINIPSARPHSTFAPHRLIKLAMMMSLPSMLYAIPLVRRLLPYYNEADYIICAPGGICMGGFQNWVHLGLLQLAKMRKKPIIYFARSIGPFPTATLFNRIFKKRSEDLLDYFHFISLRDSFSQRIASEMGVDFTPTIDSAFLTSVQGTEAPPVFRDFIKGGQYIVFVPNSLAWHHDFRSYTYDYIRSFWVKLLNAMLHEYPNHKVAMLPQTLADLKTRPDGYPLFSRIRTECQAPNRVFVLPDQYNSDEQQAIIRGADLLIGARYHSIIFAINQGVPFVSLSYEHKMSGVLEIIGHSEIRLKQVLPGHPLTPEEEDAAIRRILDATATAKKEKTDREMVHAIAQKGFDAFAKSIAD